MIRAPVLPQSREALWSLVVGRLDAIERGLTLVLEGFDCSGGQLGMVDGLARDAVGAPVLLLLGVDADALLVARAMAAADFLARVGDALALAVPEAAFTTHTQARVIVVAVDRCAAACEALTRQALPGVHVCRLEPFRVAGTERFAVRWLPGGATAAAASGAAAATEAATPEFAAPPAHLPQWERVRDLCLRIDAAVRLDGDRYRRRITWNGHALAEVHVVQGRMLGAVAGGTTYVLAAANDVRAFLDQVLRAYAQHAGLASPGGEASAPAGAGQAAAPPPRSASRRGPPTPRSAGDDLRAAVASSRLTAEEYTALGEPTSAVGGEDEAAPDPDGAPRGAAQHDRSRPLPGRSD